MTVKEHYDLHLGNFYSWMTGDFSAQQQIQQRFFQDHNINPFNTQRAFDLGAGHGLQSISLAKLGFHVTAVDFNFQLIAELKAKAKTLPVEIVQQDLLSFLNAALNEADTIVCMGDTLTHLNNLKQVEELISLVSNRLVKQGKLVLSFRDLTIELNSEQRFIPVRSDESKILTCFLEYFPSYVMVHDILHERINGSWQMKVSSYPKLRIANEKIIMLLSANNLRLTHQETINRMNYIVAEKQ